MINNSWFVFLAVVAATTPALSHEGTEEIAVALRKSFTENQEVRELIERDADVRRRFEKWLSATAKEYQATRSENSPEAPALKKELAKRAERDQKIRKLAIENETVDSGDGEVDKDNRKWLSKLIDQRGWPGKTLVGTDGAHAAWLIVQHADSDRPFQKSCLKKMQKARDGEVSPKDIAYLVDRVRVGEGKKQLYGTQLKTVDGKMVLNAVEDIANLNRRRQEAAMMPIEVYLLFVSDTYAPRKKE